MNPFIELHGADHGETILVHVASIQAVLPVLAVQGAPRGAKCQVVMVGVGFNVTETYEYIYNLVMPFALHTTKQAS